jgi:hypothetical protein
MRKTVRCALDSFVKQADGSWLCVREVTLNSNIPVLRGQVFRARSVYAAQDDFTAYLERTSVEAPDRLPHEW